MRRRVVVHVPRGLPGSGKSTLARQVSAVRGVVPVAIDTVRDAEWPGAPPEWDPYSGLGRRVQAVWEARVRDLVWAGVDVYLDRTNLHPAGRVRLAPLLPPRVEFVDWELRWVPLETCIARDAKRPDATRVGAAVITRTWRRHLAEGGR